MRAMILPLVVAGALLSACTVQDKDKDDDEGGSGGSGASSGQGGSGGVGGGGPGGAGPGGSGGSGGLPKGAPGWTLVKLMNDERNPDDIVFHEGNDLVTGIFFNGLDDGYIATSGDEGTFNDGGAIFRAKQKQVTEVLFGGDDKGSTCFGGAVTYAGVQKTKSGYVAMAHACELVVSEDGGKSFGFKAVGAGKPFGIERVLAYRETATGAMLVRDTGVVSVTTSPPGPNAIWDDVWAPNGVPPTPDPVPDDQCQKGPRGLNVPALSQAVYVSPDGQFIAYPSSANDDPQICVSTDGGRSFYPKFLPGVAEDVLFAPPNGVVFASPVVGVTFYANNIYPGRGYIYRTVDKGNTWAKVELPADVANKEIELMGGFFAPDGQHGWIVGYNYENSIALLLKTSDAGATWSSASGDLAAKISEANGGKLRTGFALDANHLWVGGEYGVLMANEAGGE
jgi:hypothetical protein